MEQNTAYLDILNDLLMGTEENPDKAQEDLEDFVYDRHQSPGKVLEIKNHRGFRKTKHHSMQTRENVEFAFYKNITVEIADRKAKIKISVPADLKTNFSMQKIVECAVIAINTELDTRERHNIPAIGTVSSRESSFDAAGIIG